MPSTVLFLAKSPLVDQFDLSSLKDVTSGAAPLGEELSKALTQRIPSISWFRQGRKCTYTEHIKSFFFLDAVIETGCKSR